MSSKNRKRLRGKPGRIITEQHDDVEAVEPEVSAEQVDPRDEKLRIWKPSWLKHRNVNVK